jgi:hypothetical protein
MKRANAPAKRKDLLAAGHACVLHGLGFAVARVLSPPRPKKRGLKLQENAHFCVRSQINERL